MVVSRIGDVLRIESARVASARTRLRKMTGQLQSTAAAAGLTERLIADEVKAVRKARAQRALRG